MLHLACKIFEWVFDRLGGCHEEFVEEAYISEPWEGADVVDFQEYRDKTDRVLQSHD